MEDAALGWLQSALDRGCIVAILNTDTGPAFPYRAYRAGAAGVLEFPRQAEELLRILDAGAVEDAPASHGQMAPETIFSDFQGRRHKPVLVIDDTATNRELAARQLARLGLACETAQNGLEGLRLATTQEYSLVLVDGSMPVMDGFEFARHFRSHEADSGRRRLPLISVTANAMSGDAERFIAAGMDDYLAKPVTLRKLQKALARWLEPGEGAIAVTPARDQAAAAAAPPIDRLALAAMLGDGDVAALDNMLQIFAADFEVQLETLRLALRNGDREALRRAAHACKSAAGSAAARGLEETAAGIEAQAGGGEIAVLEGLLQAMQREYLRIRRDIIPPPGAP
jgi:CheY-like chemotaxis protein/HPt (histidine-containing phosphotransfer) domain-containing protein